MDRRALPLSTVTLVFGVLSLPLAFIGQLCVPALVMAVLAIAFHLAGRRMARRNIYGAGSMKRSRTGFRLALAGGVCALAMWLGWATGVLP